MMTGMSTTRVAAAHRRLARALQPHSRTFITAASYNLAKKQMPKMSETEKIALGAGTVGFDRDIFGGSPSLQKLLDTYTPKLSAEEQSFLDNEVEELCKMLDDHAVTTDKDMSPEAWDYMRNKGFFSMKIPKEWGGACNAPVLPLRPARTTCSFSSSTFASFCPVGSPLSRASRAPTTFSSGGLHARTFVLTSVASSQ